MATACNPSQVDAGADVTLSGRILGPGGSPVATRVLLTSEPGLGDLLGGTFFTLLSFGTLCLAESPPEPCGVLFDEGHTTNSGPDGAWSLSLKGSDSRSFFGSAKVLRLWAGEPSGASASMAFRVQTEDLDLGTLKLWEPDLSVGGDRAEWSPAPDDLGTGSGYRLVFETAAGEHLWAVDAPGTSVRFDPRLVEDSSGTARVTAARDGVAMGTTVDYSYRSAGRPFSGSAGAPPSRGKPCSVLGEGVPSQPLGPCPVTDGNLTRASVPVPSPAAGSTASPAASWLQIDLGRPARLSLVVVRGCSCPVEASADGVRWESVGSGEGPDFAFEAGSRTPFRYVRVGGQGALLSSIREVSVWTR